ncbi:hypothetical protein NIES4072_69280 [Nostoc commune NIES-4072]|uniref:Uncharacterized protein n=1 Tax=Nostoc commune NIES-4072 TaxID=2005467 RepID=A0A2R5FWS5_NOSCO|nr:hypothetical protein [Nostoc commune]BBD70561.1 hypothetical protein NIES4070_69720 [Nostoc commune HK-02]GBG23216.1 hypothetical protein NIES4072_69280 [Nostoc commune NIES-4072]
MTTALKAINGGSKQRNERRQADADKSIRPHCKVSIEDINWVRQQPPSVQQLWLDSVAAEQFGGSAHKLDTNLTYKSLQKAGAALTAQGLFQFEEVFGRLPSGRPGLISYRVRNLHGYYNRFYWESSMSGETNSCDEKAVHAGEKTNHARPNENYPKVEQIHADLESFQKNIQKSEDLQGFQKPNNVSNNPLTTYQQPTKVVGMVVGSDAPTENPRVKETAHAPLRGASPQFVQSVSELEEELPAVKDCTSLTLVDDAQSNPASLLAEKQDCGVEPRDCHEGTCSAAPPAQIEKSSTSAIANQAPVSLNQSEIFEWLDRADLGECPPLWVIQYLLSSKYYASMRATISKFEKQWNISVVNYQVQKSSEALFTTVRGASRREDIAMRSQARLLRMEKLKMASLVGENPGFDFLQQCWSDDPALQIVIKKLVVKFPQWGIAIVDGVLVDWEG